MGIARLVAILVLALAPAAQAAGSDPLLSGYGGPGDGEQALLGETLIRESSASGGGTQGATAQAPAPDAIYEADTATPTTVPATAPEDDEAAVAPARKPPRRPGAAAPARPAPAKDAPASVLSTGGEPASAPAPVAGRDLALLAALLLTLLVLAGCARRLAVGAARARRVSVPQLP